MKRKNNNNARSVLTSAGSTENSQVSSRDGAWVWGRDLDEALGRAAGAGWNCQWIDGDQQKSNWEKPEKIRFADDGQIDAWNGASWIKWVPKPEQCARVRPPRSDDWYVYDFIAAKWVKSTDGDHEWNDGGNEKWTGENNAGDERWDRTKKPGSGGPAGSKPFQHGW